MNIELKGTVGDKIAIIGTITQVTINENGVEYAYDISHEEDIKYIKDGDYIVPYKDEEKPKKSWATTPKFKIGDIEEKPEEPKEDNTPNDIPVKRKPGRPKKATVEGAMKKLEEMKARGEA